MTRKLTATVLAGVALAGCAAGAGWYFFLRDPGALVLPGLVETQEVRLCSKVGGRVLRTEVREGDLVRPGQALVVFEAPELHAQLLQQQARLAAAQADLDRTRNGPRAEEKENARAALAAARARHAKLRAGNRAEEIEQARADLASAEAEWLGACRDKRRAAQMIATRAVSQQEYDAALAAHDRLSAKRAAARARLKLLEAGARAEDVAEAAADVDQKRASYELLRQGSRSEDVAAAEAKVAELQARVEELKATLAEAVVTAPQRAVVEVLAVRKGDVVGPNQPVARVLCADELWVKVYVPETELGKLRLRQAVAVSIDAYPGRTFRGEVYQINAVSEFTPRNVQSADERRHQVFGVKVRVADPQGAFKSGMAASVRVNLARPEGGLGETKP